MARIRFRLSVMILVVLSICSCASGHKFVSPLPPLSDAAILYVFRPNSPPYALRPTILINGVKIAELTNMGYFNINLKPGKYSVEADWSSLSSVQDKKITFDAEKGHTYYISVAAEVKNAGASMTSGAVLPVLRFESGMGIVDSEIALSIMPKYRLVDKYVGADEVILPK